MYYFCGGKIFCGLGNVKHSCLMHPQNCLSFLLAVYHRNHMLKPVQSVIHGGCREQASFVYQYMKAKQGSPRPSSRERGSV